MMDTIIDFTPLETAVSPKPIQVAQPTTITAVQPIRVIQVPHNGRTLSSLIRKGQPLHERCSGHFMRRVTVGYYHYERETKLYTCAIAAAFVAAFGTDELHDTLGYSEAVFRLSRYLGYDLDTLITGPTGRESAIAKECIFLVDKDGWSRRGVAEWLESVGL